MKILIAALMLVASPALGATWQCEIKADRVCLAGDPCRDEKPAKPLVFRIVDEERIEKLGVATESTPLLKVGPSKWTIAGDGSRVELRSTFVSITSPDRVLSRFGSCKPVRPDRPGR
jgi:hypothetical protein